MVIFRTAPRLSLKRWDGILTESKSHQKLQAQHKYEFSYEDQKLVQARIVVLILQHSGHFDKAESSYTNDRRVFPWHVRLRLRYCFSR